jgi:hypothetical protein
MMAQTTLDQHMALLGRIMARFLEGGLTPRDIRSSAVKDFLGVDEDNQLTASVLRWMLDEGLIRAKDVHESMFGDLSLFSAQLTSRGLAVVKRPLDSGDTIEKRIQSQPSSGIRWNEIGDLIGGTLGGLAKSLSG